MTARLILCPPTAAALDRLNDCREQHGKLTTEARRNGETPKFTAMYDVFTEMAAGFVLELLDGAVYTDTDDPRVAALEAKVQKLQVYAKEMEDVFLQEYGVQYGDYGSPDARRKVREEYGVIDILPDETEEW